MKLLARIWPGDRAPGEGRGGSGISLRLILTAAMVLLSVLPVAIALTVAILRTSAQAREQAVTQMDSLAQARQAAIAFNLQDQREILALAAPHSADLDVIADFLRASTPDTEDQATVDVLLGEALAAQGSFSEFFIYDPDGVIRASTDARQVGKVVFNQPYFDPSLEGEYTQPPFYELGTGTLNIIMTRPLVDRHGRTAGVLAGRLDAASLAALMAERSGLGETGEAYLISLESNYLLTPSRYEGYPLTRSYHSQAIDSALAGTDGTGAYESYRGETVIGAFRWLPELQVGLVVEISQAEALAASRQATLVSVIVAITAGLAAAALGLIVALRVIEPVTALTRTTRALAKGDLTARAPISAMQEIGELGASFNQMAGQLQNTLTALEESVQEARLAMAMAREANRLKSEFLSTMSHELRTPLNAIVGFTEILLAGMSGELTEKQHHKIERVHLNSKRLLDLINDLLDLAKIEAGRIEVQWRPFSPRDLAESVRSQVESLAEQRKLAFTVTIDPGLPATLLGDQPRIEQIAKNLLSNAFKFTREGHVAMHLAANGGQTWELSVTDTGIGIPPHALEFIFDEFRQLDGSSQRAYGGSGLGLSITRNLARIMNGEVRVTSMVGKGSTFTVSLPLVTSESEAARLGVSA